MPNPAQWAASKARQALYASLRRFFVSRGFDEVETPILVPAAGMEPHIDPFEVSFVPQTDLGRARGLYLHTSPEYAMKRLLADGCGPIFQLCKVFRNGEIAALHNPEFSLLEFYRPGVDYQAIMDDLEQALSTAEGELGQGRGVFAQLPYERLTVREAVQRHAGFDLAQCPDAKTLAAAASNAGVRVGGADSFEDVFFHLFLQKLEPRLGEQRPTFLLEYPASMASLARLKPGDPSVAERVELYVRGVELANGFSELTDANEQRARLIEERDYRLRTGRTAPPLDEEFLAAVGRMPPSAGIAVGLDRVLMLMLGHERISEVLLFPAQEFA